MKNVKMNVVSRSEIAGRHGRRLRRAGKIPAVIYGGKIDPLPLVVDDYEIELQLRGARRSNAIYNLAIDGGKASEVAMIRDIQRHPVNSRIQHIDFIRIDMSSNLDVEVSLHVIGRDPLGVRDGGVMEHLARSINIVCAPTDIPQSIEVDLTDLKMNETFHVRDLKIPDSIEVKDDSDMALFHIAVPAALASEDDEKVEGEEVEAAEGVQAEGPEVIGEKREDES
jgi:large subunit ribosomal protein L25